MSHQQSVRNKVEIPHTIIDLIKQKKLKLFGHICTMEDQKLVMKVMPGMVEGDRPRERQQEDGVMILQTGVDVQSQRRYDWQTTDNSGDESMASTAHTGYEFRRYHVCSADDDSKTFKNNN